MPTATTFGNLITFSRGSNATVTGPTGLIQYAPNNLLTFSEQFDNAAWNKLNATITANSTAAPDGTSTADTMADDATSGQHRLQQSVSGSTAGITYAFSVYAKAGTHNFVQVLGTAGSGTNAWFTAIANLATGAITQTGNGASGTLTSSSITSVGNGWYRIAAVGSTIGSAPVFRVAMVPAASGNSLAATDGTVTYAGTGTSLFMWGAQAEIGSTATSYNNTTVKNLLGFSEAFDNAAWTKTRASIVTGAAANPINGLFNAQKLMEDTTASNTHFVVQFTSAIVANTRYVQSVYAKAGERGWLYMTEGNNVTAQAWFDLVNGAVGTVTGTGSPTASITAVGNGWYRCSLAFTPIAAAANVQLRVATGNNVANYTGDGNSGVYIYGAQLSDSASLDPYVPTPGAAPTSTAYYGPRFDYDPVTLQPRGLLIEEARTNLILSSDGGTGWNLVGTGTVTATTGAAPDGSNNAFTVTGATDMVVPTGGNNVYKTFNVSSATAYTISLYVKAITATTVSINIFDGSTGGNTSQAIALTSGWQRVQVSRTSGAGTTAMRLTIGAANGTVLCWGAQAEAGSFATSYIPTVASQVTRSADVATISGSLFSQWYGQTAGTFVWAYSAFGQSTTSGRVFASGVGGSNTYGIFPIVSSSSQNSIFVRDVSGDAIAGTLFAANAAVNKGAVAYAAANFAVASNGAVAITASSGAVPSQSDQLRLGRAINTDASYLNGHIRSIDFIPARLSDTQLQAATT